MTAALDWTDGNSGNKPLALVIEDEPNLAKIFAIALDRAGYLTQTIEDGQQALHQLATTVPTLVLLDLHLPYVSGSGILQYIRSDPRLVKTRVILATADAVRAESLDQQADLVLLKPISFQQLRDLARRLHPPDILGIISEP